MFEAVSNHISRLICPLQSTGQVGKSTVLSSIVEYLKANEISYRAIDADGEHKTLSRWYSNTLHVPFSEKNDLLTILGSLGTEKVQLIDFPAQATTTLLKALMDFDAIAFLAERGIRVTIVLFANQDQAGMVAASDIFKTLGRTVDYLVVENPVKFGSSGFWKSRLGEAFENDAKLTLPALPDDTVYKINLESKKLNRVCNFIEAVDHLQGIDKMALSCWKKEVFSSLHSVARVFLPVGHEIPEAEEFEIKKPVRSNLLDLY